MATNAPTGTTTSAASRRAINHGKWWSTANCENVVAPIAANTAWHSDT